MAEWDAIKFVLRFAAHIVLGGLIFAFVAAFTVGLHWGMNKILDGSDEFPYARSAIQGVELFIFAVDLVCVVVFIVKETWLLRRSLLVQADTKTEA